MSVPFSNIHLRVPRGFGNILEGLAREVLREQPNDIPTFAALYFNTLLKQREESGLGPAEWGARLEDRFYSNPAFKSVKQDNLSSAKDKESGAIPNEGKELDEPKGEIVQSPKITTWSDNDSDTSEGSQTVESVERDEFDKVDQDIGQIQPELTLESSYKGVSDIDICAEELKGTEDKEQTSKMTEVTTDDEILKKAEQDICKAELVPPLQPPFGGLANLDVCAEGFKSTEGGRELTSECSEDSRNLINTSLTIAVESPDEVEIHDGLTLSGVKSPEHSEQDVDADLVDKNDEEEMEKSVTGVGEVPKMDYPPEHSQFTVSDMTEGIRVEEDITDPYQGSSLDKEAEYVYVLSERSTFDGKDRGHIEPRPHEDEPQSVADMPEFAPEQSDIQHSCEPLSEKSAESMAPSEEVDGSHSNPTELDNEDTSENDMDVVGQEAISTGHFSSTVVGVRQNEKMSEDHGGSNMIDEDNLNSSLNATEMDLSHDCAAEFSEVLTSEVNVSEMDMKAEDMFNDNDDHSDDSSDDEEMNQIDLSSYCQDTVTIELDEEERDQENDKFDNEEVDFPQANEQETSAGGKADTQQDMLLGGIDSALESVEAPHEVCAEELAQVLPDSTEENSALEEQHESMDNPSSDNNETEDPESKAGMEECNQPQEEEDVMDIPLDDPEANKAAAKIQAGFRGHMTRKKMKDDKPSEEVSSSGEAHNGSQGDTGGAEGLETDDTSVPEQ